MTTRSPGLPGGVAGILLALIVLGPGRAETRAEDAAVVRQRLLESLQYLAGDARGGRGVGTPGLDEAAEYLAQQFAALGLRTDLVDGGPFQPFEIPLDGTVGADEQNRLLVRKAVEGAEQGSTPIPRGLGFQPMIAGGSGVVSAPLVFAGYGITAPDHDYDDYAGLDVQGRVVLILRREPRQDDPKSPFQGVVPSRHALFRTKLENAQRHKVGAVILVNDLFTSELQRRSDEQAARDLGAQLADWELVRSGERRPPLEEAAPTPAEAARALRDALARLRQGYDTLPGPDGMGPVGSDEFPPVLFASRESLEPAVRAALGRGLADIEREIDSDLRPRSAPMEGWTVEAETKIDRHSAKVRNVIAAIDGEGPHAAETIVIGAHYDHLGNGGAGSLAPWTREIHNGADDNASGTALLLEVARQLAARPDRPTRRIVFIAFSGEELGLLGSRHFVRHPVIPLDSVVAMYNLDMVGRLTENRLQVHGTGTGGPFDAWIDELNRTHQFELVKRPGGNGPSDHATFYGQKIPVLHFFTDLHKDYHRPSDDVERLEIEGMRRIGALLVDVIDRTLALDARPEYHQVRGR